ncbi:hypothetical protein [Dyadobacter psychrophilus]|uniref:Uncharacterized protein n=1 Tax=Dyadobacter psychrophilus TaxID=651661 RepID=A0A1T5HCX0_9BACT|nr:hypothetical protein [Dyadobacter psychrophilus]SKC18547.1 hypothetical protein SAMN05660293_05328 [Dyadobacter psychrophilus]
MKNQSIQHKPVFKKSQLIVFGPQHENASVPSSPTTSGVVCTINQQKTMI